MKSINYLHKTLLSLSLVLCFFACKKDVKDIEKVQEKMELKASSTAIALDENNLSKGIVTFTWEPARAQSDDHLVTYTTRLDVVGNNFGTSTAIMNYEDDGVYGRSFTSEQLQNWANEKWKIPANQTFTLEFRVVAEWEGGSTFEAPEVRTMRVNVTPIKTIVFDADKVFLAGSAILGSTRIEMPKTLENANQYAYVLNLQPGDLEIPVEYKGATNYIATADGVTALKDGTAVAIKTRENAFGWKIETAGKYRVVVNMQKATATIYSPAQDLKPASVNWILNAVATTTEVNALWTYGEPTGWAWRAGSWTQSLADPQIFVYSGPALTGRTKFGVAPTNQTYVYTGNNTATNTAVTLGISYTVYSGYSSSERDAYFSLPSGTNFMVLDLRNRTYVATKR
ncbi:SusE domain-containing protein [Pedobacter sp. MC2016-14]|uniref:SusE domain-containing protein n=1 Tax=Pedobacter sp. MC2016-14 TaxID=2897327 RepID=UPI001E29669F|nr:SusE domain-containing protein [Pedobacter sp. MC2016-14]MCD0489569.1 SusE domain-containing protein [Pedobacter sp. MC2016-14]